MSSSQQPSSSSIPSHQPFVSIENWLDTPRATRADSLDDNDCIPSTSKAALPGLWKAGVQSVRKLTQKIRPPTEEELFYDDLATFELPQKTPDASPPIYATAEDIRTLLQTIDLEALQTPPGLGVTPQIFSAAEVESFGSTHILPSLIIKARDKVGSSKLIDGKPGYFYLDPAAVPPTRGRPDVWGTTTLPRDCSRSTHLAAPNRSTRSTNSSILVTVLHKPQHIHVVPTGRCEMGLLEF